MADTRIIIRNLGRADYALLSRELGGQNISPVSVEEAPGRFGEPVTVSVILAIGAASSAVSLAVGIAAWLMKKSDTEQIDQDFEFEHPGGRIERRHFHHTKRSQSATDPELLKALKETLPDFSQSQ